MRRRCAVPVPRRRQAVGDALGQRGVQAAGLDVGVGQQRPQERDVRGDAEDGRVREGGVEAAQRRGAVGTPGRDLGEHRVVGAGDGHAFGQARVDADALG